LREVKEKQRGHVKVRDLPPHGRVVRLLTDETGVRFGFLHSRDGREIYFHENALVDLDYDDLEVGTEVRFAEEQGNEGPQASTVAPLNRDKVGPAQEEEVPLREI
jgi:cold shock CspA family protein